MTDNMSDMARSASRSIRMPDVLWEQLNVHASAEGISAAEFIREAILFRIAWTTAGRLAQQGFPVERLNELDAHTRALLAAARLLGDPEE